MLIIILCSLVAVFVLAFAVLRLIAPAIIRTSHKIEAPGIDRMEMVEIGGIQQALYIRGQKAGIRICCRCIGQTQNAIEPINNDTKPDIEHFESPYASFRFFKLGYFFSA